MIERLNPLFGSWSIVADLLVDQRVVEEDRGGAQYSDPSPNARAQFWGATKLKHPTVPAAPSVVNWEHNRNHKVPTDDANGTSQWLLVSRTQLANPARRTIADESQIGRPKLGLICMGNEQRPDTMNLMSVPISGLEVVFGTYVPAFAMDALPFESG